MILELWRRDMNDVGTPFMVFRPLRKNTMFNTLGSRMISQQFNAIEADENSKSCRDVTLARHMIFPPCEGRMMSDRD